VSESFPPDVNGVAHTAVRVAEHLLARGHEPLVIAPEPASGVPLPDRGYDFPIVRVRSVGVPLYPGFRVGLPGSAVREAIDRHHADLVHLAGPFVLGAGGCAAAIERGIPAIAVYATDLPAYARAYHTGSLGQAFAWWRLRKIHNACDLTLAPSTATAADLREHGIERVKVWARGVDCRRFDPAKSDPQLRAELAPDGEVLVGYVGRLATEKRLDLLATISRLPGAKLVIVGSGPAGAVARRALPSALFLGELRGEELARTFASFDIFVHAGPHDTFGNTLQEAAACALPVVAPAAGGPLDLVRDGVTGFLVPPADAAALAGAVSQLITDPALRRAQGLAGRHMMLGRSWAALCDELIGHYGDVLESFHSVEPAAVAA
jgi:phosphatidylinositol alpha 1,6-mannosyltransferase